MFSPVSFDSFETMVTVEETTCTSMTIRNPVEGQEGLSAQVRTETLIGHIQWVSQSFEVEVGTVMVTLSGIRCRSTLKTRPGSRDQVIHKLNLYNLFLVQYRSFHTLLKYSILTFNSSLRIRVKVQSLSVIVSCYILKQTNQHKRNFKDIKGSFSLSTEAVIWVLDG